MPTPFPSRVLVPVYGTYDLVDGSAASGTITFTPRPGWLGDDADNVIIVPSRIVKTLDPTGFFTVNLSATDDPELSPSGWTWTVTEQISGNTRTYDITVPISMAGAGINLREVVPASPSPGTVNPSAVADEEISVGMVLGVL